MRLLVFSLFLFLAGGSSGQSIFTDFDVFFKNVVKEGWVDYQVVVKNKADRQALTAKIAAFQFQDKSTALQKAFLINAYNFLVIEKLANGYPVSSPKSISGFFIKKDLVVGGKKCSLDQLENDLLFGLARDPRFHLVLICGARGCPPFPSLTFTEIGLEAELEQASRAAVNNNTWLKETTESIELAQLFNWYGYDFGDLGAFLRKYRPTLPKDKAFKFIDYDWGINDYQQTVIGRGSFITPSQLLSKGTWEFKAFQSAYLQKNKDGFDDFNTRSTFFSSFNQFTFGLNPSINVGLDVVWKKNLLNDFSMNSWWRTFDNQPSSQQLYLDTNGQDSLRNADGETIQTTAAHGLAHLGPKIKFKPFKKLPKLTFQETVYIPINKNVDGQLISFTQFFYDQNLGSRSSVFLELSFWTPIAPDFKLFPFARSFWSYFPNRHWSAYAMLSLPGEYGAGLKINITRRLELEMLHTRYIAVERFFGDRVAQTWNMGLRIHP